MSIQATKLLSDQANSDSITTEGPLRLPELVIASVLFARGVTIGAPSDAFALSELAIGALALLAIPRKRTKTRIVVNPLLLLILFGIALLDLILVSHFNGAPWLQRSVRVGAFGVVAWGVMTGRLSFRSIIVGLTGGFIINAGLYYAGLTPDDYPGYLTGWTVDKNYAGLFASVVPFLASTCLPRRWQRIFCLIVFGALLFLTGSRTSMSAFVFALAWVAVSNHRSVVSRAAILAGFYALFTFVEAHYARIGMFEERWGTDLLRDRIDAAATEKVNGALPWGLGAGEGEVLLAGEQRFFFHNSYQTLLVEGGWILAVAICLIMVLCLITTGPFGVRTTAVRYAEASIVALGICAMSLGEVHFTGISALSVGAVVYLRTQAYEDVYREVECV